MTSQLATSLIPSGMSVAECVVCGSQMLRRVSGSPKKYCSSVCQRAGALIARRQKNSVTYVTVCKRCGAELFEPHHAAVRFCGSLCAQSEEVMVRELKKDDPQQCRLCGEHCEKRGVKYCASCKQKAKGRIRRDLHLRGKFGLTYQEAILMLWDQDCACAICGSYLGIEIVGNKRAHLDHNHACCGSKKACRKCVRGWLCAQCNLVLGFIENDLELFHVMETWIKIMPLRIVTGVVSEDDG